MITLKKYSSFMSDDANFVKLSGGAGDGPFCDTFAPTLGRVYDPCNPDTSIGEWNHWWAEPANPTFPLDPNLSFASFDGNTVAQVCQVYGNSAGGTGFDISRVDLPNDVNTGKKWFQYVRIDDKYGDGRSAELDAVSDVSCCGDYKHPFPDGDITQDCRVNFADYWVLAEQWLNTTGELSADIAPDNGDGIVDYKDIALMSENWLWCTWQCE